MKKTKIENIAISRFCAVVLTFSSLSSISPKPLDAQVFNIWARIQSFFSGSSSQGVASGRQGGGGKRDRCPTVTNPLMAIAPADVKGNLLVGKTISERPVFWFYVPYSPNALRRAEFVIIDEKVATVPFMIL